MNLTRFFEHWSIRENPFKGEEARHDAVLARVGADPSLGGWGTHSDFDKVLGDLTHPSSAVVFGEKGAGKTAMRLQIASRIAAHNTHHPMGRVFLVPYDDLNAYLDHYARRESPRKSLGKGGADPFEGMRVVDHLDVILSIGVGRVMNALVPGPTDPPPARLESHDEDNILKRARKMPAVVRRDLLVLQALYDTNDPLGARTARLAKMLRLPVGGQGAVSLIVNWLGWVPGVALFFWVYFASGLTGAAQTAGQLVSGVLVLAWFVLLVRSLVLDRLVMARVAGRLSREMRMVPRSSRGLLASIKALPGSALHSGELPVTGSDEVRYELVARLRRVLGEFGFTSVLVVIDRVDEPTLVSGDAERMRSIVWPMLNNKFLQLEGVGVKMLLPIELRHALFKESSTFFQEARLDKQNLVERLSWTGATLYDLCTARLNACRPGADRVSLSDLFDASIMREDLVEALGAMLQPRDAIKFVYKCLSEHCAAVTEDDDAWTVGVDVFDRVKKDEADRVMQLSRGIRPA